MNEDKRGVQNEFEENPAQVALYRVDLDEAPAWIELRVDQKKRRRTREREDQLQQENKVKLSGWILFEGQPQQEGRPQFSKLRNLAIWSQPIRALDGGVALAGPVKPVYFDPSEYGVIDEVSLHLYYSALGREKPACEEIDATYPLMEMVNGALIWSLAKNDEEASIKLEGSFRLAKEFLGQVRSLRLDPISLPLHTLTPHSDYPYPHQSLSACSGGPLNPGASQQEFKLKMRFISVSTLVNNITDLNTVVNKQVEGACQVWWQTGGLKIEPDAVDVVIKPFIPVAISGSPQPVQTGNITQDDETAIPGQVNYQAADAIEVYLVDSLLYDAY
ncbi:MAG: hypothetical protein IH586_18930, partial [Anaerolineaceae bacterium]|nr:hypothetical protein [Anaerolineaceae bacterium]